MMRSLRRSSVHFTLSLLPVVAAMAIGCGDDTQEATSVADTGTGTADEIGDGDVTAESGTMTAGTTADTSGTDMTDTSASTDATDTSASTDATDTSDSMTTATDTSATDTSATDTSASTDATDTSDTATTDATTGGGGDCAGGCGMPDCGDCPDNVGVNIPGNYSIATTEVRNSDYEAFLDVGFTSEFLAGWLPAECDWKADFTPTDWPANPNPNLPVVDVDWCDAWAYCEWSGQHLCGKVGGGPAQLADVQNPAQNQWYKACTGGGVKNYPYGLNYMPAACNGAEAGIGQLSPVGSLLTCVGGYAGLHDMSGNVWEWENACAVDPMVAGEDQNCHQRGGSYFSDGPTLRCGVDSVRARNFRNSNLGIRCCDMP